MHDAGQSRAPLKAASSDYMTETKILSGTYIFPRWKVLTLFRQFGRYWGGALAIDLQIGQTSP